MKRGTFHKNTILYCILSIALSIFTAGGNDCIAAISSYHTSPASPESSNPSIVPQNGIFELTLADQVTYSTQQKFLDFNISVTLTSPSSVTTTVYGFYYNTLKGGTSLWKARFSPSETGDYNYTYVFTHTPSSDQSTGSGSFQVIAGSNPGFIRQNPSNKFRWEFSNGEPFHPYGFNGVGGLGDAQNADGGDRNGAFVDGRAITNDEHLRMFFNAGFNIIRFSQDNGAIKKLSTNLSGNEGYDIYDETSALYYDWFMQKMRNNNFRIYFGLFGFEDNIESPPSPERLAFVRYAVDRWAAYVDVWEIFNEEYAPDPWLVTIANEIRARDPYNHPITTSFESADHGPEIEITAPHDYAHESEFISDQHVLCPPTGGANYKIWGKPVILGEQGNSDMNWLPDSALRMRLRGWTSFFKEVGVIFWQTSWATNGNSGWAANIYLGHEERQYTHILMWFVDQVLKSSSVEASVTLSDDDLMRAYGLSSSDGFAAYIHHYADHSSTVSGESITINIPQAGQGYWIDPKTGKLLSTVSVNSGSNTLTIPGFVVDIVFFSTASLGDTKPIAHVVIDNPQADGDLDNDGKADYGPAGMPFGMPPLTLNFDASGSYDLDGGALSSVSWDYGDGSPTGSGASVSHSYPDGVHLTTLSVTDNEGNVAKHSFLVRATADPHQSQNDPPIFSFPSNSITVREGEPVIITVLANDRELDASSTYVGKYEDLTYSASDLPPGSSFGTWGESWSKQFFWIPDVDQAGSYQVQFNVQDAQGAAATPQTITINVSDVFNITNTYSLTVSAINGTVTKNPDKASYNDGDNVTLQAIANTGYNFVNWAGDLSGSVNPVTIVMDSNKNITAHFGMNPYSLTISAINGYVTKSPDQASYIDGAIVTLEAIADPGYAFSHWSGDAAGSSNTTTITMDSNKSVTANFAAIPETISSPTSISGPSNTYVNKTESYTASGASSNLGHSLQYRFDWGDGAISGWGSAAQSHQWGDNGTFNIKSQARCESHIGEISAWPDTLRTVTVSYLTLSSSVSPSGTGSVTKNPNKSKYTYNEPVQLTANVTTAGYSFTNWSGDWSDSVNPVTIDMDSDKTITANFAFDGTNPSTNGHIPGKNSDQAARDTIIQLHIADSGSGVEYESVTIQVGGHLIYDGANETSLGIYDSTEGVCRRIGTESDYTYVFQLQPLVMFDYEQKVDVVINATDKAGNDLTENYHFYTVMRTFGKNVKVNSDTGTLIQNNPATARDSLGNIWVVWDQTTTAGDTDICIGKLPANGSVFVSSVPVINAANNQSRPVIAIDSSDKMYVVWQGNAPNGHWDIFVSTSTNGTSWSSPVKVNSNDTNNENNQTSPAIAIDGNGKVYITWEDNSKGDLDKDIVVTTSSNATTWTSTPIATAINNQNEPAITIDTSNTAYIVWTDARNTGRTDIYGADSDTGSWGNVSLINTASNQSSPVCAASGEVLHLLWVDESGYDDIIYGSGPTFVGTTIVDEGGTVQSSPSIVADEVKVFACWQDARNLSGYNDPADIYYAEKTGTEFGTNILVNDDIGTYTQTAPAIGIDIDGNPYMVWVDNRQGNNDIYYAGAMSVGPALATGDVTAISGGTVAVNSSLQVDIPAGALTADTTVTIAEIVNPPELPSGTFGAFYEFSPGGLGFNTPVTVTLPHTISECPGYSIYRVYWYNAEIGTCSQNGITNVRHVVLSSTLHAVRFQTIHFTGFGTGGSIGGDSTGGGGGGGGGGGCSISHNGRGNVIEYMLPYVFYVVVLLIVKLKDARNRKAI